MLLNTGKHVMLSYNHKSKDLVKAIWQGLIDEGVPVWFDEKDMDNNMYDSMAKAVKDCAAVCCFLTPEYENSDNCKSELEYAKSHKKLIIVCMVSNRKVWKPTEGKWLDFITKNLLAINFSDVCEQNMRSKIQEIIKRIRDPALTTTAQVATLSIDPFHIIKKKYLAKSYIQRAMNSETSVPIEHSYINLALVETKEQHQKEKRLKRQNQEEEYEDDEERHTDPQKKQEILNSYEEIYDVKKAIDVKNLFNKCEHSKKKILVLGRAGIGKSTFCQYVTYRWAKGELWTEYDLVILISLRNLTESNYPQRNFYGLLDIVGKEYLESVDLTERERSYFEEICNNGKVFWILDGYDEFVQKVPKHLESIFNYIQQSQHHLLTSRPYSMTLPYDTKMEIIGFTNENIIQYIDQFFDQIKDEMPNALSHAKKLKTFLKTNSSIWGVIHIPINLELICTQWADEEASKSAVPSITALYDNMVQWFFARYLARGGNSSRALRKQEIYKACRDEMRFLEHLAFHAIDQHLIMLPPEFIEEIEHKTDYYLSDHSQLLNVGVLKSYDDRVIGDDNDFNKQHYFVHLTFQEYFAARHLLVCLQSKNKQKAIEFIKKTKFSSRFHLVYVFASGLLTHPSFQSIIDIYFDALQGPPTDLIGLKQTVLLTECVNELLTGNLIRGSSRFIKIIDPWIGALLGRYGDNIHESLSNTIRRAHSIINSTSVQNRLLAIFQQIADEHKVRFLRTLRTLPITLPMPRLISTLSEALEHNDFEIRISLCYALGKMSEKEATNAAIFVLKRASKDESDAVRCAACNALGEMGEQAATSEVILALMEATSDESDFVRWSAYNAITKMGEAAPTNEVIFALIRATGDKSDDVRQRACDALAKMGEKAATSDVISALVEATGDESKNVRQRACNALTQMGATVTTSQVISALIKATANESYRVRSSACDALGILGQKAVTNEVISALIRATDDESDDVRQRACDALTKMAEKTASKDVILALIEASANESYRVRSSACNSLGNMGEKAATSVVISALIRATSDVSDDVRQRACYAFGRMGEKAATNEVIFVLIRATEDETYWVRQSACDALTKMAGRSAANEIISALIKATSDRSYHVRSSACDALGNISEWAVTSEVISALIKSTSDRSYHVRSSACDALGNIGETAATNEVISALIKATEDEVVWVRQRACNVLIKMGGKLILNQVICVLIKATTDKSDVVREYACDGLGNMGERAATSEVMSALIIAIGDEAHNVRQHACEALAKINKKAVMSGVILTLIKAMENKFDYVRCAACAALGTMSERAGTSEMISILINATADKSDAVRERACDALGNMGERAATSEVISTLMKATEDQWDAVRCAACIALRKMGENACTSQVVTSVVNMYGRLDGWKASEEVCYLISNAFNKNSGIQMDPALINNVVALFKCIADFRLYFRFNSKFISRFFETKAVEWVVLLFWSALFDGIALTCECGYIISYESDGLKKFRVNDDSLIPLIVDTLNKERSVLFHESANFADVF